MDAIDNLIYSALNECIYPSGKLTKPVINPEELLISTTLPNEFKKGVSFYNEDIRKRFVALDDPGIIADSMRKHWFDVGKHISYTTSSGQVDSTGTSIPVYDGNNGPDLKAFIKFNIPPYHMIFSYLVENTRIAQIFEKLIRMYLHDEKLTKAEPFAFRWIQNTEALFYNSASGILVSPVSRLRPSFESTRRNAYYRLFGMDLDFGDINNNEYEFHKAEIHNSGFIPLFEKFLKEFWRVYQNVNDINRVNPTDTVHLEDLIRKLQEMLMNRRSNTLDFKGYQYFNLSAEEYSSHIFIYWLYDIVSYNSPVVKFLNAESNNAGERLMNIGKKVGLDANSKSMANIEIAHPMSRILRSIEEGTFENSNYIFRVMRALAVFDPPSPPIDQEKEVLTNILSILNNWEEVTGNRIINVENP